MDNKDAQQRVAILRRRLTMMLEGMRTMDNMYMAVDKEADVLWDNMEANGISEEKLDQSIQDLEHSWTALTIAFGLSMDSIRDLRKELEVVHELLG